MNGKYQVRKVRRDGVSQRYWVNPTREHEDAVTAVMSGDLAVARSRKRQELARKLLREPSVQESLYRSLVRHYEETKSWDPQPILFLHYYLARGYPEVESLLVRLATQPSDGNVRTAAIHAISTSMDPRAPRLLREVADKSPDEETARVAIVDLAGYLDITMENLISEGIAPSREEVLDALETLGLALQGKWFRPEGEIGSILAALNCSRSEFEQAVQGPIPAPIEEKVIDGLKAILTRGSLSTEAFEYTLDVIKKWESAYSLRKLRTPWLSSLPQRRRAMVIDAINEIEHRLKRKSG
jgi:hypothetical protein